MGYYTSYHPVLHLIERKNTKGLDLVLEKLKHDLSSFRFLSIPKIKLELCTFASPTLATRLLVNKDFDISNIENKMITTPWHEAARENPYGADFMEWLKIGYRNKAEFSKIRNALKETILEHAVKHGKLVCVEWLCKNTDLSLGVDNRESARPLSLAARSMAPQSLAIFKIILREMPTTHTHDFEVAKLLSWEIAQEYKQHSTGHGTRFLSLGNRVNFLDTTPEHTKWLAIHKCQALESHLPTKWTGSRHQKAAASAISNLGCGFLANHMKTPPPEARSRNKREYFFGVGR